jgi:hypothetical protein
MGAPAKYCQMLMITLFRSLAAVISLNGVYES